MNGEVTKTAAEMGRCMLPTEVAVRVAGERAAARGRRYCGAAGRRTRGDGCACRSALCRTEECVGAQSGSTPEDGYGTWRGDEGALDDGNNCKVSGVRR
jgi:hypothetical protein